MNDPHLEEIEAKLIVKDSLGNYVVAKYISQDTMIPLSKDEFLTILGPIIQSYANQKVEEALAPYEYCEHCGENNFIASEVAKFVTQHTPKSSELERKNNE